MNLTSYAPLPDYQRPIGPPRWVYRIRASRSGRNLLVDRWVPYLGAWRFEGYLRTYETVLRLWLGMGIAAVFDADGDVVA